MIRLTLEELKYKMARENELLRRESCKANAITREFAVLLFRMLDGHHSENGVKR